MRVCAAGSSRVDARIEVWWGSVKIAKIEGVEAYRIYRIEEVPHGSRAEAREDSGAAPGSESGAESSGQEWFQDVSDLLQHSHVEEAFDDFQRQPLLPMRLTELGPGIAWHDFSGDGWDD